MRTTESISIAQSYYRKSKGKYLETATKWKQSRINKGLCVRCGKLREKYAQYCNKHQKENKEYGTKVYKDRIARGLCFSCGNIAETSYGLPSCLICWFKDISRRATGSINNYLIVKEKFYTQCQRCAYTGDILIPKYNASIDHKTPLSRGGTNEPGNLQWVTKSINALKSNRTHEEFIALCKEIVARNETL